MYPVLIFRFACLVFRKGALVFRFPLFQLFPVDIIEGQAVQVFFTRSIPGCTPFPILVDAIFILGNVPPDFFWQFRNIRLCH